MNNERGILRPDVSGFDLNVSAINPQQPKNPFHKQTPNGSVDEFEDEPPLLEDLGIDVQAVKSKLLSTVLFLKPDAEFVKKPDMTGPMLIGTTLGVLLAMVVLKESKIEFRCDLWFWLFR